MQIRINDDETIPYYNYAFYLTIEIPIIYVKVKSGTYLL